MNSSEIIIGAMLISPMMGSIIGISYAMATGDFKFFKRAFVALGIQIIISIITSTIYFLLTPISIPSRALIARTMPTIWDVIIAIAGGTAGAIGLTRKEKGNILPGVAIATGLVPPLCTVGYGISTLSHKYSLGAIYLFFINAFFICVSAMVVFQIMKMPRKKGETKKEERKIKIKLVIISIITIIPSILLAYPIIKENAIEGNVQKYLDNEFKYESTQIVKSNIDVKNKQINLALLGKILDENDILELTNKLKKYDLQDMSLKITQTEIEHGITKEEVKEIILNETKKTGNLEIKDKTDVQTIKENAILNIDNVKEKIKKEVGKIKDCAVTDNITQIKEEKENKMLIVTVILDDNLTVGENEKIDNILKQELGNNIVINKVF